MSSVAAGFTTVVAMEGKDFGLYVYDYTSYKIVRFREGIAKSCSKRYAERLDALLSSS